ncbi:MAG: GAF domain-containing sensor histidine kinase [Anaerolineae bacterium]|nr:GAF domain-containing sensor histidine kinase [Phycisphaerae bacterium]
MHQENFERDIANVAKIDLVQKILGVVCRVTGLGFSAVARVTDTRWIACAVRDEVGLGLQPGGELQVKTTICDEIRQSGKLVVIDHVSTDDDFCHHLTPQKYGFQSYISVPITLPDGRFFGTLCALDPKPATLKTSGAVEMFTIFADLIAQHIDAQDRMAASEAALLDERQTAQLREQFIAVLGHDLRNPLNAISSGAAVLSLAKRDEQSIEMLAMIQRSAVRMNGLIGNVLDLARGRLGGGITLNRSLEPAMQSVLEHVINELQTAWPKRVIEREIVITRPVLCDAQRIAQMLSNLLANALAYCDAESPVSVAARTDSSDFEMCVTNVGETIPPEIIDRLFEPFVRGAVQRGREGLGLGLYIAYEIARAHGGALSVASKDRQTRFTFRMPRDPGG